MDFALPLFAFYLLVFCNFLREIIGCKLQQIMEENIIVKYVVGFGLLFFLIILANAENADQKLGKNFLFALAIYIWFLITIRNPYDMILVILAILLISYLIGARRTRIEKEGRREEALKLEKIQTMLTILAFIVSLIGFGMYYYEKRQEYGNKFSLERFIVGKKKCRGN